MRSIAKQQYKRPSRVIIAEVKYLFQKGPLSALPPYTQHFTLFIFSPAHLSLTTGKYIFTQRLATIGPHCDLMKRNLTLESE